MFQRPPVQQRRTLNSVNHNSAFLNHHQSTNNNKFHPPPPPPIHHSPRQPPPLQQQQQQQPHHRHPHSYQAAPTSGGSSINIGYGAPAPSPTPPHLVPQSPSYNRRTVSMNQQQQQPNLHHQHHSRKRNSTGGGISFFFFLVWTILLIGGGYIYFNYFLLPELLNNVTKEEVEHTKHHWMTKYHTLQLNHEALEKAHSDLKHKLEHYENDDVVQQQQLEETNQLLEQERTWAMEWKQKALTLEQSETLIRQNIQEYSKHRLIEKYGNRELAVEMELNFATGDSAWITVTMAPIEQMPHTIFTFLEQVSMGLYDDGGYAFHHNANHIIMGSPIANHLTPENMDPMERFTNSGVDHVLFQEYSTEFPHVQYTVGFAGRPGGPNLYFNTNDNVELHGPNGYAQDGLADPCFGIVTRGQDLIDRIHGMTGEFESANDWRALDDPVAIRWIKVLN